MTIQEINKVLQEVRQAKTEVDLLLRQIEEMKEEAEAIRAITYDGIRVQSSPKNHLEETIIRIEERSEKLSAKIEAENEKIQIAVGLIQLVERPEAREALFRRYIWLQRTEMIARQMDYSTSHTYTLLHAGKAEISEKTGG